MKKISFSIVTALLIITLLIIGGEIAIRGYHYVKYGRNPLIHAGILTFDETLGWRPTENYQQHDLKLDAGGRSYSVEYTTDKNGFRMFGNPHVKDKQKVIFVGDSYTQAEEVSNDKTYYGLLKDSSNLEVFAYGGLGYGNLQEYMVLNKFIEQIQPDVIVLQFCSNDFINNYYELELRSSRNNNAMRRPYMTKEGRVVYAMARPLPQFREFINMNSRFLYSIFSRLDKLASSDSSVEDIIAVKGREYELFQDSVEITERLLGKIKARIPTNTMVYAFSVDGSNPYYDEFRRMSHANEFVFMDDVPRAIEKAEEHGVVVKAADNAHWNEMGHKIVSDVIAKYLLTHR